MEHLTDVQPTDGHSPTFPVRVIALDADLVRLAGDGNAALVLRQLLFWWHVLGHRPFYKFNSAAPQHRAYRLGDSWLEETGLTRSQFETARKRVAVKVQGRDPQQIEAAFAQGALAVYWTTEEHLTWYTLNEAGLRALAPTLYERCLGRAGETEESPQSQPPGDREHPACAQSEPPEATSHLAASPATELHCSPPATPAERVFPASVPETPTPASLLTYVCALASGEAQDASAGQDGSMDPVGQGGCLPAAFPLDAAFPHPECSLPTSPDAAPSHLLMQDSCIGITESQAETFFQREQPETSLQRSPSLPPTARARASQEEEGHPGGWVQPEQAKIQAALEAREVFTDPARQIAERAVREGLGVDAVVELFESQIGEAGRSQARNPLTAAVWRLQHQALHLPRGARARAEAVRAFLAESPQEAGEAARQSEAEDTPQEGLLLPGQAGERQKRWQAILADLRLQMTRATFEQWLRNTHLEGMADDVWVISTPNRYAPEVLTHRLGRLIRQTLARQVGKAVDIRFEVAGG